MSSFDIFQENDILSVDCENMTSLRVLLLGHNKLTSIHGLTGAENLDVLDLSHNFITRIGENWALTLYNVWLCHWGFQFVYYLIDCYNSLPYRGREICCFSSVSSSPSSSSLPPPRFLTKWAPRLYFKAKWLEIFLHFLDAALRNDLSKFFWG